MLQGMVLDYLLWYLNHCIFSTILFFNSLISSLIVSGV